MGRVSSLLFKGKALRGVFIDPSIDSLLAGEHLNIINVAREGVIQTVFIGSPCASWLPCVGASVPLPASNAISTASFAPTPIGKAARTESYYLWLTATVVKQSYSPAGLERARVECFLDQVKRLLQGVRCRFPSYRAYFSAIPEGGISLPFVQYRSGGLRRFAQRPVQAYGPSEPDAVCKIHRARLETSFLLQVCAC